MATNYDDYRGPDTEAKTAGDVLGHVDKEKGTIPIMGFNLPVGKQLAYLIGPFYEQMLTKVAQEGGRVAFKHGYQGAKAVGASNPTAYKAAKALEFAWGFGPTIVDTGANVTKSVRAGHKAMSEVKELLTPYLAANHDMSAGLTSLMSDSNRGVRNLRAFLMKKNKNELVAHATTALAKIPSLMLIHWRQKADELDDPERMRKAFDPKDSAKADEAVAKINELRAPKEGARDNLLGRMDDMLKEVSTSEEFKRKQYYKSNLTPLEFMVENHPFELFGEIKNVGDKKALAKQIFQPKHSNELALNLNTFNYAPAVAGIPAQWLREKLTSRDDRGLEDFAVVQAAALAAQIKKNAPEDHRELADQIYGIFETQFRNCGNKKSLSRHDAEKIGKASSEIAEAIIDRGLNPYALIDLIGGDKLAKFNKGNLTFTATHERAELISKELAKYTSTVDKKELCKDLGVKPEDLKKIYDSLSGEERILFVMVTPPDILEQQGVDKKSLAKDVKDGRDQYVGIVTEAFASLKDMDSDDLKKKYTISDDAAKNLLSVAEDFTDVMSRYGEREGTNWLGKHRKEVSKAIAKAGISSKDGTFWRELVVGARAPESGTRDREVSDEELARMRPFQADNSAIDAGGREFSKPRAARNPLDYARDRYETDRAPQGKN